VSRRGSAKKAKASPRKKAAAVEDETQPEPEFERLSESEEPDFSSDDDDLLDSPN
jgi:hypothetical protein